MVSGIMVCLTLLVLALQLCSQVTSKQYIITPEQEVCCNSITLTDFAALNGTNLTEDIVLFLQPGLHILAVNFEIHDLNISISMVPLAVDSESPFNYSEIQCVDNSRFIFTGCNYISIANITFNGCGGNQIIDVDSFEMQGVYFNGLKTNETGLKLINTKGEITGCVFSYFTTGSYRSVQRHSNFSPNIRQVLHVYVGGAIIVDRSNVSIILSVFSNNQAQIGGALFAINSNVLIDGTNFSDNGRMEDWQERTCYLLGDCDGINIAGALYLEDSNTSIRDGNFRNNSAQLGGCIVVIHGMLTAMDSFFDENKVSSRGAVLYIFNGSVVTQSSSFRANSGYRGYIVSNDGGVIACTESHFVARNSVFQNNEAANGGVLYSFLSTIMIQENCSFENNYANNGGVLLSSRDDITISSSSFSSNSAQYFGGVTDLQHSDVKVLSCLFHSNAAFSGTVFYTIDETKLTIGDVDVIGNVAHSYAIMYLSETTAHFYGLIRLMMNSGSLMAIYSDITFDGLTIFSHNQEVPSSYKAIREGGAMTVLSSDIRFRGKCHFNNNFAMYGGAVHASSSKLYITNEVHMYGNIATVDGGGIYLKSSELNCQMESRLDIVNNTAVRKGGGIHAINTSLKTYAPLLSTTCVPTGNVISFNFSANIARKGGGLSLETGATLNVLINGRLCARYFKLQVVMFRENIADYGGAIYVDDTTNTAACDSRQETECFFQILILHEMHETNPIRVYFSQNTATHSGGTLYGGLLDRCTVSPFAISIDKFPMHHYLERGTALNYFKDHIVTSNVSISSAAMKVCTCNHGDNNCTQQYNFGQIEVKKGQVFSLLVVAVDQSGQPVSSVIRAALTNTESGLAEGQLEQPIPDKCTQLAFSITSPHEAETLSLFAADGPCKDADLSTMSVQIAFLPCTCPIGFQPVQSDPTNCTCTCHEDIVQYVQCDISSESLTKNYQSVTWISYDNVSSNSGYLVYLNCPYDYCKSSQQSSTHINLNEPSGADAQCAFNRSSLLCGSCQTGLSLSLGSSLCLSCPSYWPVLLVFITIAALIAGVALIAILLLLNMTVAVGSMNGLIFYANIVAAYTSILLPFSKPTYATVFISWLNLELGIDTCFVEGMDAYSKTWIELLFPTYIIIIIIIVIVISSYSSRFSNAISNKHPVATLTTLLLLSYAKLLALAFKILAFGTLEYPNGSRQVFWLLDATVKYLAGKHIVLAVMALVILLLGLFFAILLFSWQWLLHLPKWKIFIWSRNPKLQTFVETYHIPFNAKHRYWPGLLLLVRALLYLVAAVNVSNDPKVALTSIAFCVGFLFFLKGAVGNIYKKCFLDILEIVFYFNILSLCLFTWYSLGAESNEAVAAHISVSISMALLILIMVYHIYTYTNLFAKLHNTKFGLWLDSKLRAEYIIPKPKPNNLRQEDQQNLDDVHRFHELMEAIDRQANTNDYRLLPQNSRAPTQSVVELPKREANKSNPYNVMAEMSATEEKLDESISHVPAEC